MPRASSLSTASAAVARWQPSRDIGQRLPARELLYLGASDDGRRAIAVELVDGEARALEGDRGRIGVGLRQLPPCLLVVEPRDESLRPLGRVVLRA